MRLILNNIMQFYKYHFKMSKSLDKNYRSKNKQMYMIFIIYLKQIDRPMYILTIYQTQTHSNNKGRILKLIIEIWTKALFLKCKNVRLG